MRNGWPFLEQAVTSCLGEMGRDDSLLILDNGSTDQTVDWSESVAAADPRARLVRTGAADLPAALNAGLALTETPLVARMDADDLVLPGRFEAQVAAFAADDGLVLCGTQIRRFSGDPARSRSVSRLPTTHDEIVAALLAGRHAISHPTVMFRRDAAEEVGGYWASGVSEDCDFFLRISRLGRLANLPVCGLAYRFHGGSLNAQRQIDILVGMRYAADTYTLERDRVPDLETYRAALLRDPRERRRLRREALGDRWYRDSQVRLLRSPASPTGWLHLLGAALLRADRAVGRITQSVASAVGR